MSWWGGGGQVLKEAQLRAEPQGGQAEVGRGPGLCGNTHWLTCLPSFDFCVRHWVVGNRGKQSYLLELHSPPSGQCS